MIDNNQSLSSVLNQVESITVDVIDDTDFVDVIVSFDGNRRSVHVLKASSVKVLLDNLRYLNTKNFNISSTDCTLVLLSDEDEQKILEISDMENSIGQYVSTVGKAIQFQISILIKLIDYETKEEIAVPVSCGNLTVEQLMKLSKITDARIHPASNSTKMVLPMNYQLTVNNETQLFLVHHHQTCLVSIERLKGILISLNDELITQQYISNTTVGDIYKQNKDIIEENQYLLYGQDIVPSCGTVLQLLIRTVDSPIDFRIIDQKLVAKVTVTYTEQETSIEFQCKETMMMSRVRQIVCQLWKLNEQFYSFILTDGSEIACYDYTLNDLGENIDDVQLTLVCAAEVTCTISYGDVVITM
ncbi:unnamed protein product, partial [Adineta ricciae]